MASGCTGTEVCDNGLDDDCNNQVDEGCGCSQGAVQRCFLGPPGRRGVGACADGHQLCLSTGWGPCVGGVSPTTEQCDALDNDCDGCVDDLAACCGTPALSCPRSATVPAGAPGVDYQLDGQSLYAGPVGGWHWTVSSTNACEQLLRSSVGASTIVTDGGTSQVFTFRPMVSGDHTVTATLDFDAGTSLSCSFVVRVKGPGLRVEQCSNVTATADLDLHLHRPGTTTPWFGTGVNGATVNTDDCYFNTCTAQTFTPAAWGYADSPLSACSGTYLGAEWVALGSCPNPRLEFGSLAGELRPENINVDQPALGVPYRGMVHYYAGTVTAAPLVSVYCGGEPAATYGAAPDTVTGFSAGGGYGVGPMWRFANITMQADGGCTVDPLHPPGLSTGYWVTNGASRAY